jgi:hypothetical protein
LAVVGVLAVTGPNLIHLYDTTVAPCAVQHECPSATAAFTNTDGSLRTAPVGSSLSRARKPLDRAAHVRPAGAA